MGKPSAPAPVDYGPLLEMTRENIESNEKLFGEYMGYMEESLGINTEMQESLFELQQQSVDDAREASLRQNELQQQALDYQGVALEQQAEMQDWQKGILEKQEERADDYFELMRPEIEGQTELATAQRERYLDQGMPFENQYLQKLSGWDSAARRDRRRGEATADVSNAVAASRANELRRLESFGIDPSQTRSAALDSRIGVQSAVAQGAAATQAERMVEREGIQFGGEAVNLYRGLPSSSASALGAGSGAAGSAFGATGNTMQGSLGIGQQALGAQQANMNSFNQLASMEGQNRAAAAQMFSAAGNQLSNIQRNNLAGWQTGGNILGQSQNMAASGYGTANAIYGNELGAYEMQMANSPLNVAGGLIGTAIPFLFEDGGYVDPRMSRSRGAIPDDVPARLTAGEAVIPEETVRYHGLKTINKLNKEAQEAMGAIPERQ